MQNRPDEEAGARQGDSEDDDGRRQRQRQKLGRGTYSARNVGRDLYIVGGCVDVAVQAARISSCSVLDLFGRNLHISVTSGNLHISDI